MDCLMPYTELGTNKKRFAWSKIDWRRFKLNVEGLQMIFVSLPLIVTSLPLIFDSPLLSFCSLQLVFVSLQVIIVRCPMARDGQ
jgi:hypothetical protein